jgi:hypothetical protein
VCHSLWPPILLHGPPTMTTETPSMKMMLLGGCRNWFFDLFLPFLAIYFLKSRFSNARLMNGKLFSFFLLFRQNLAALAGHRRQIF